MGPFDDFARPKSAPMILLVEFRGIKFHTNDMSFSGKRIRAVETNQQANLRNELRRNV